MSLPPELEALLATDNPFFRSSQPFTPMPMGLPGMSGGASAMTWMALEPLLRRMLPDGFAQSFLFSRQNLFAQLQVRQDLTEQMRAQGMGHMVDQARAVEMMRGMASIMGTGFNERAASAAVGDMSPMMRIMAGMAPDAYESMLGTRGSAELMSRNMFLASRYMRDPVTGGRRLSSDSLNTLNEVFYDSFYGPGASSDSIMGLPAGRAAGLLNELVGRGYGPPSLSRRHTLEAMGRAPGGEDDLRGLAGAPAGAEIGGVLTTLMGMADNPELNRRLREFSASRVRDFFGSFNRVFSNVQDLLSDMGVNNASPGQMLATLNALTGGMNASGMTTEQMSHQVARIQQMGQLGITPQAALQSIQFAGTLTDQLGLRRSLGAQIGPLGLVYGRAYANIYGSVRGSMDPDFAAAHYVTALAESASSSAASQIATITQLAEYAEADRGGGINPALASYLSSVRAGRSTFTDTTGRNRSVYFRNEGEAVDFYRSTGGDARLFHSTRTDASALNGVIGRYGIAEIAMGLRSSEDIAPHLARFFGARLDPRIAGLAVEALTSEHGIPASTAANATEFTSAIIRHIERGLGRDMTDDERSNLRSSYSNFSRFASSMRLHRPDETTEMFLHRTSPVVMAEGRRESRRVGFDASLSEAVTGLVGRTTVAGRMLDLLGAPGDTEAGEAFGAVLSLVTDDEVRGRLETSFRELSRLHERARRASDTGDFAEADDALARIHMLHPRMAHELRLAGLELRDVDAGARMDSIHRRLERRRGARRGLGRGTFSGPVGDALERSALATDAITDAARDAAAILPMGLGGDIGAMADSVDVSSGRRPAPPPDTRPPPVRLAPLVISGRMTSDMLGDCVFRDVEVRSA